MGIIKSFKGAAIRKPGSYSFSQQSNAGGAELGANGTLLLLGEAAGGAPGAEAGLAEYSAAQMGSLVATYGSGPIVDCARAAQNPSKTPGVQGFDKVVIWKTNASTRASLMLVSSGPADLIELTDANWGIAGNGIAVKVEDGTDSTHQRLITVTKGATKESLPQNAAAQQISIQYNGSGSAATLTISGATESVKALTTTCTGASSDDLTIPLNGQTLQSLVQIINAFGGGTKYTAVLINTQSGTVLSGLELDPVTALDIKTGAQTLYRIQNELVELINANSNLIRAVKQDPAAGVPVTISTTYMSGGTAGASTDQDFADGLAAALSVDCGVILPAISRDAADDIIDGLTDPASTYTIAAQEAGLDTNLRLRGSIKNRKEAQGVIGHRDPVKADVYTAAQTLSSELVQMWMQDVLVLDQNASLSWKHPHVGAAMVAGIRLGTPIGEPATFKFLNCNGIGHAVDPNTGLSTGDFDPAVDFDPAIDAGVTFAEKAAGGFRIVVDNTTYGKDQSFVFNRGSVVEAAQYVAKTVRQATELAFVGKKISNGAASSIKGKIRAVLDQLNDPSVNIITSSADAPKGYVEKTFVVTVEGNTCRVSLEIKPVQGLDFILIEFTLGDISQSA